LNTPRRQKLLRIVKLFASFILLFIVYVTVDFFIDKPDLPELQRYRINLPPLDTDKVYFFKVDNKQIVIVHYSDILRQKYNSNYLVAYALGTYLECPLKVIDNQYLQESCSSAKYDFSGKPLNSNNFTALRVPVYNFCPDHSCINLRL